MQAIKELIPSVLQRLQSPEFLKRHQLVSEWAKIVGEKIAAHTQPKLSHQGALTVWVDQPVLAFELSQKYRQAILKRVQSVVGEREVKTIRFLVGQLRGS